MGCYYFGDIEGKFWFAVQNSDDANFFGVEYKKIYNRKCGCTYSEEDECCCEIEHLHVTEEDVKEDASKNVCQPDCDKKFEENGIDLESYSSIEYTFTEENLESVKEGLEKCFTEIEPISANIREILNCKDIENFINDICKNLSDKQYSDYCTWLARLELGLKIFKCLETNGTCNFECEI